MNRTALLLSTLLGGLIVVSLLTPTASAYPWGPVGPPPPNQCGYAGQPIQFGCFYYSWNCSPSYNENPDICSWQAYGFCSVYTHAAGCIIQ